MVQTRNRREQRRPRRAARQPLCLEVLEDRTLLSASPTTLLDLNGLSVDPNHYSSTDILVQFQGTPGTPGGPALAAGTTLGSPLPLETGFYQVNLDPGMTVAQALSAYKAEAGVLDAEPDYELTVSAVPNDPMLSQQWAVNNTQAEQAWNVATGSPKIVVAVMDTGIDYNSPDLYQNIWINQAEIPNAWYTKSSDGQYDKLVYKSQIKTATPGVITFRDLNNSVNRGLVSDNNGDGRIDAGDLLRSTSQGGWMDGSSKDGDTAHRDDLFGWNFVSGTNNPLDDNGHGTHVSGILGATGNNGAGVAGVDWNVQIMPVKFIGSNGDGSVSNFVQGLNYAVQHGAKVTNNSWEGAPYSTALYNAFKNAQAHGVISVAAAGNEGKNNDTTPDYPGSLSTRLNSVVAVAATTSSNQLASFSNYGANSVALAAPGVNILSTLPGGKYGSMSGTSMATPEVTGAMALVWGLHPNWSYTQVINQVLNTTKKLPSLQGKVKTGGLLDLAAAVGYKASTSTATHTTSTTSATSMTSTTSAAKTYTQSTATTIQANSLTASTLNVPAGTTVGDLQVKINATFPVDGNLYIYLVSPDGHTLALDYDRGGTGGSFTNTVFSDKARTPISSGKAPFSGTFRPETALNNFKGLNAGGTWRLMIKNSGGRTGRLLNWSLTITPGTSTATTSTTSTKSTTSTAKTYSQSTASAIKPWGTAMSTLNVPAGTTIGNLVVKVNVAYPADGKLYIYLIAPNGRTLALVDQRGGTGANFTNTVFSDKAPASITSGKAPYSGVYRPETALSYFKGMNAGGTWRLAVRNYGGSSGTLHNWLMTITPSATTSGIEASADANSSAATASSSTPSTPTGPVESSTAKSETPQASGQSASEHPLGLILSALSSGGNTSPTAPSVANDQVFASPEVMAQLQSGLVMGKRPPNDPADPWSGWTPS